MNSLTEALNPKVGSHSPIDESILQIKECRSESEVAALLAGIVGTFGVTSYVFISMRNDDSSPGNHRYLIGCTPAWCQLYNAKKWIYIDPFIQYALRNSAPIAGSAIEPNTSGQAELLETAAENGFRSGVVIPAHAGNKKRVGVLYLGSNLPPEEIEPILMQRRTQLRAVAMELFEWWEARIRAEVIANLKFNDTDVALLKLVHEGFTAEEIARILDIAKSTINVKLRRLNEKLDVHSKKQAAEKAIQLGILSV
jgi:DNA-binding CsgD family transcriptional regulator